MLRAWKIVRMQSANLPMQLAMPWGVLLSAFLVNLLVFGLIPDTGELRITGALASIYVFVFVAFLITMTQVFPFALGLSVTRKDFFAGTSLLIVLQSLGFGIVLTILLAIEQATDGWGLRLHFMGVPFLLTGNWFTQVIVYAAPFLLVSYASVFFGTVYKRWNQAGMWVLSIGGILLVGGGAALITWLGLWPAIGRFFTRTPIMLLIAGYPTLLAALAAGASFLILRRATA